MRTVYAILPSSLVKKKRDLLRGVKTLEGLGFRVLNRRLPARLPSPRAKAREIHSAFSSDKAQIVLAQRGGCGSMKVLPHLDFELIRRNPKVLAGFSDLSALLNAVHQRCGLVTLHSPMIINLPKPSPFTLRSFLNALDGFPRKDLFAGARLTVCRPGVGRGVLKGGNLVTLSALMGTEWEIDTEGSILFLEDVDEKLHQVDRHLTQWILAGKLNRIRGLILGDFRGLRNREVYQVLSSQMKMDFPVVHCPCIGHVRDKVTLPVGAEVELDARRRTLTLR